MMKQQKMMRLYFLFEKIYNMDENFLKYYKLKKNYKNKYK